MRKLIKYDIKNIKFNSYIKLKQKLDELGSDGWEIISYKEIPTKKFGDPSSCIILIKKEKSWLQEKMLFFMKKNFPQLLS